MAHVTWLMASQPISNSASSVKKAKERKNRIQPKGKWKQSKLFHFDTWREIQPSKLVFGLRVEESWVRLDLFYEMFGLNTRR